MDKRTNPKRLFLGHLKAYGTAILAVLAAFVVWQLLSLVVGPERLPSFVTFYPSVLIVALLVGLGPGFLATTMATLAVVFWISPEHGELARAATTAAIRWVLFFIMGASMSVVAELYRRTLQRASDYERKSALRGSETQFQKTLDRMLEGCQIIGFDWRYVYLNDAAEKHNRRPKNELLGKLYVDVWPGIGTTEVFASIRRCM